MDTSGSSTSPYSARLRLVLGLLLPVLGLGALLRIVLYAAFHDGAVDLVALGAAIGAGLGFDLLCTLVALMPVLGLLACLRMRWLGRPRVRGVLLAAFFALLFFDAVAQYYFFEEFNARYNHIALDYLMYPTEVIGNIRESYNVPLVAGLSLAGGVALAVLASRSLRGVAFGPWPWRARLASLGGVLVTGGACVLVLHLLPSDISTNRITSEVAQNGLGQLVRAFRTAELDYASYYTVLPRDEARARAARVLGFAAPTQAELQAPPGEFHLSRTGRTSASDKPPLDVVVVMEESLGSNFVGALGHSELGLTPNLDRWSHEGLLLTNLVANGNRTVRGLEGVLCSFVPLPGDSIVKRPRTDVATLARVFEGAGYATCFLYGGYGMFDNMKPFMTGNGWQEFVEQPDYPSDAFRTAWGVADEYIFDALLARQQQAHAHGEHLFATLMSVSNHRPYEVPAGRIDLPASRRGAVKYADWALGRYLDQARAAGVLEHTLVLVVGDHGARVYGAEQIPVASYRIPALFLAPESALPEGWTKGRTLDGLCSQIDLAPTLLGLAGLGAKTPFLGVDLLASTQGPGRAFVQHNFDIGILTENALVVLRLNSEVAYYKRSGLASSELVPLEEREAGPELRALQLDAAAVFQTADELFRSGAYDYVEPTVLGAHPPPVRIGAVAPH